MTTAPSSSELPASVGASARVRTWGVAALLTLPWLLPIVSQYVLAHARGLHATGFIQGDEPYYMANAREAFDASSRAHFTPWYGNPFTYDYQTPRIYFQPLIFLLGLARWLSRLDPGIILAIAHVVAAIACGVVAIRLLEHFAPGGSRPARGLTLVSFFWGGGLLCLTGLALSLWQYGDGRAMLALDPGDGWWFQNFGRNLVYATEAFYHALFFGAILALVRKRFVTATVLAALLSASHPFTGIQLLAILIAWALLERVVMRNAAIPWWFLAACLVLATLHVGYYLVYLPTFPEHRQIQAQWMRPWRLEPSSLFLGAIIVGALAATRLRAWPRLRAALADPDQRLLVAWFGVSLALANHDLVMRPVQPLHFTRGYIWTPLFLLGAPVLVSLYQRLLARRPANWGRTLMALLVLLLVSDNALWLADHVTDEAVTAPHRFGSPGFALRPDQWQVLRWLDRPENAGYVVASEDPTIGYLTTVYTPLRSWRSHENNTPWTYQRQAELTRFFRDGVPAEAWRALPLIIIYSGPRTAAPPVGLGRSAELALRNSAFVVYRYPATPTTSRGHAQTRRGGYVEWAGR